MDNARKTMRLIALVVTLGVATTGCDQLRGISNNLVEITGHADAGKDHLEDARDAIDANADEQAHDAIDRADAKFDDVKVAVADTHPKLTAVENKATLIDKLLQIAPWALGVVGLGLLVYIGISTGFFRLIRSFLPKGQATESAFRIAVKNDDAEAIAAGRTDPRLNRIYKHEKKKEALKNA